MSLESIFRATLDRFSMVRPGDRVVVAVSGGADSVALLHLLLAVREERSLELVVAHLDHGWRGAGSAADRAFVIDVAGRLGLPHHSDVAGDPEPRDARLGPEGRARARRRRFLQEVAVRCGARRIATGHTRDDQAETVLLRLLRGAGSRGLGGIRPVAGRFIRPLLEVSAAQVRDWLRDREIPWREDPTNQEPGYERNRVRHRLIPLLEREFRPGLAERLAATAALLREDDAWLERQAEARYREIARDEGDRVWLPAEGLESTPAPLARRMLRQAWERLRGEPGPPSRRVVERLGRIARGLDAAPADLGGGLQAVRADGWLGLRRAPGGPAAPFQREVEVPGQVDWPEGGFLLRLQEVDRTEVYRDIRSSSGSVAHLDLERTGARLALRNRRPGDVFYPLGLGGRKKVQDFLVDRRIPRDERDRVGLLTTGGRIVWVVGHRIDERFKVTPATRRVLRASREPA